MLSLLCRGYSLVISRVHTSIYHQSKYKRVRSDRSRVVLPVFKMHFKKILKLLKNWTKSSVRASWHSICSRSRFTENQDFRVVCKKTNFDANKRLFTRHCFLSFYISNKKNLFSRNLLCAHRTSRCTRHIFVQYFLHFQNVFPSGGRICSQVPKRTVSCIVFCSFWIIKMSTSDKDVWIWKAPSKRDMMQHFWTCSISKQL